MDIIKYAGGAPANFLDVGGGASADQLKAFGNLWLIQQ
jgi:succinyl-CoA synthetase beta subunit